MSTLELVTTGRRSRARRRGVVLIVLAVLIAGVAAASLMVGNTFYTPGQIIRVMLGETVPGASFTVGELRLPRTALAILAGFAFGVAGASFQTMLRNPLASPDIIGISSGASAAAVIGIVVLSLDGAAVSLLALVAALLTAGLIALLSSKRGIAGTRLILVGIGVGAMLDSVIAYVLSRAAAWDIQTAMQWLTGSLNNASWDRVQPLAVASLVLIPLVLLQSRGLGMLRLGDEAAAGLGVRVGMTRIVIIFGAVALLAFATAASGPIAFVAFMAGPVAARIIGSGSSILVPAGLVGILLTLSADLVGQYAFDNRFPVGVVTGILGAPFLIYLLIRTNRQGGSL